MSDLVTVGTGGDNVVDSDYSGCVASERLTWRCDLAFPWQTAAETGQTMAALGVRDARVSYVVTPKRSVTETLLNGGPNVSSGRILNALRQGCPSSDAAHGPWVALGASAMVMATATQVVAVDFSVGTWSREQRNRALTAAQKALAQT